MQLKKAQPVINVYVCMNCTGSRKCLCFWWGEGVELNITNKPDLSMYKSERFERR